MLSAFQDAFVALAADAKLRRAFAADPAAALEPFALEPRERAALVAIPGQLLDRYAASLIAKRWGEVARVVPLTLRISPKLGARYRAWLAGDPARALDTVLSPGVAEALRALAALRRALADDPGEAVYSPDLLAFEVLRRAATGDGAARFLTSRYRIHEIAADIERGVIPMDPDLRTTEVRFDRGGIRWRP